MKTKAFTLIEILIAGAVLGAVVFAVLRMSTNNAHQVSLIENEKARQLTEYNIEQCILSLGYTGILNYESITGSISFGNTNHNQCLTGTTETGVLLENFLGENTQVTPVEINNFFTIATGSISHTITLTTSTEKNTQTHIFSVVK